MALDDKIAKLLADVSDDSAAEADKYFAWAKKRRQERDDALSYEFQRYRTAMLREGVHSAKDVSNLLGSFYTALQGTISSNDRLAAAGAAEHLAQLCADATAKGVALQPVQITGSLSTSSLAFPAVPKLAAKGKLQAMSSTSAAEGKIKEELARVQRANGQLDEKVSRITAQFHDMMQKKADVGEELNKAQQEVKELRDEHGGGPDPVEVAMLQKQIKESKSDLVVARRELAQKLNEAPQYQNMKKMLQKKNDDLDKLRGQLAEHELVFAEGDEEDGVLEMA